MIRFVVLCLGAFLIGLTKTGLAVGRSWSVTPLLALVLPPKIGLGLMLPLLMATDVMAISVLPGSVGPPQCGGLAAASAPGYCCRQLSSERLSPELLVRLIGLLALGFGMFQLYRTRKPILSDTPRFRPWLGALAGVCRGRNIDIGSPGWRAHYDLPVAAAFGTGALRRHRNRPVLLHERRQVAGLCASGSAAG